MQDSNHKKVTCNSEFEDDLWNKLGCLIGFICVHLSGDW